MDAYQRYGPALMRKCRRMLQSREDAEDVVQGLFVDLISKGQHDPDLPYLYRAVTNRCINHLRYGDNRRRLLKEHDVALRGPARTACDERIIGLDLLIKLMDRLDEKSVEVVIYRFFDDMSQDEIAKLTRTSRKTVGKRLKRAREQVARFVQNGAGGGS